MTRGDDISLTERETSVLGPLAEHRFLTVPQLALLLDVTERTAVRRLRRLEPDRLIRFGPVFQGLPWAAAIERRGLRALGSTLTPPQMNFNEYRHDVGLGWLWLAARSGRFGELRGLTTDRRMQAEDRTAVAAGRRAPWGVGLGLLGRNGRPQRHYPDLMLETASGHRVAVELELTGKSSGRMARIMAAYASDAAVDHVLYLVDSRVIGERVIEAARRAGIAERVHVQRLAPDGIAGAEIGRTRSGARAGVALGAARSGARPHSRARPAPPAREGAER